MIPLLAACRGKDGARPAGAPADPTPEEKAAIESAPGALTSTGQIAFNGASSYFCVPHGEGGLQVDFRTGSAEMPVVAVRIDAYHGSGPYAGRLFVTGRSATGALVTSTGEASVDVKQQDPIEGEAPATVSGTFKGQYDGEAGAGSIAGRFESCNYSPTRGGASPPVAGAVPSTGGTEEQPAGAAEESHERPSDASRLSARSRAGHRGARDRSAATGRRGRRARSPHGGSRPRGRRGHRAGVRGAG
jgi:hypothetical protein